MALFDRARQLLGIRQSSYQQTFKGPVAEKVLRDLATFCSAHSSTYRDTERQSILAEGRRQVWLRIAYHMNLSPDQAWDLYDGREDVPQ